MIPTLIGITLVCFTLTQLVPGGPVEEYISQIQQANAESGVDAEKSLSSSEVENIKAYFGFDKPAWKRYLIWASNLIRLDLGDSYSYERPVWNLILEKMPISLFFGITSFLLSYLICIPLGVYKAMNNGKWGDTITSIIIFSGYVMPAYALGVLFIVFLCGGSFLDWFPIAGIVSDNFEFLPWYQQIFDLLHHLILPLICFMIGEFAVLTMLMKNSLLDELKKDYIKTALVKGSSYRLAIWKHAVRNALLPIATRISEIFTIMFTGALLIEKVFDIDGMGLLSYNAILSRDYNLVMGIIFLSSVMTLFGRLFSDIIYVVVDPRIDFK